MYSSPGANKKKPQRRPSVRSSLLCIVWLARMSLLVNCVDLASKEKNKRNPKTSISKEQLSPPAAGSTPPSSSLRHYSTGKGTAPHRVLQHHDQLKLDDFMSPSLALTKLKKAGNNNDENTDVSLDGHWSRGGANIVTRKVQEELSAAACNPNDSFTTATILAIRGNLSLATDDQLRLLESSFLSTFNNLNAGVADNTLTCDPLFREIVQVVATTNISSLSGTNDAGELVANSVPLQPVRVRRQLDDRQAQNKNTTISSGLNRTITGYSLSYILMDITGLCRGCASTGREFVLFDDTSDSGSSLRRMLQQGDDNEDGEEAPTFDDPNCQCPVDAEQKGIDIAMFEDSFSDSLQELQESGQVDFVEEIGEVIPVIEKECPTEEKDFSIVYYAKSEFSKLEFSRRVLLQSKVKEDMELLFRDSYNGLAQQWCDPVFRSISTPTFISTTTMNNQLNTPPIVEFEFLVQGTCRGDDCSKTQPLFDECRDLDQRRSLFFQELEHEGLLLRTASPKSSGSNQRFLMDDQDERCFCRVIGDDRPPSEEEFLTEFQTGLEKIMQDNKFDNCLPCEMNADCKSGKCLSNRCSEGVTSTDACGVPSSSPSSSPSVNSTAGPTFSPSLSPNISPSSTPSETPSKTPSNPPSKVPTSNPSKVPTSSPSTAPTRTPSTSPTSSPSKVPTSSPSNPPTSAPSKSPTSSPSNPPTASPSKPPTSIPSNPPTSSPSKPPTSIPSKPPTSSPSKSPTSAPSNPPTSTPSQAPSSISTYSCPTSTIQVQDYDITGYLEPRDGGFYTDTGRTGNLLIDTITTPAGGEGNILAWMRPVGAGDPVELGSVTFNFLEPSFITGFRIHFAYLFCAGLDTPAEVQIMIGSQVYKLETWVDASADTINSYTYTSRFLDLTAESNFELEQVSTAVVTVFGYPDEQGNTEVRCAFTNIKIGGLTEVEFLCA